MDSSLDLWSLVEEADNSWDTSLVRSPPIHSRPKSSPLHREILPQDPRLASHFQVSDLRSHSMHSKGCLGPSSDQQHSGIPRVSDLNREFQFHPLQQLHMDSIRIIPRSHPLQILQPNLPVSPSWMTWQQNFELPQPHECVEPRGSGPLQYWLIHQFHWHYIHQPSARGS